MHTDNRGIFSGYQTGSMCPGLPSGRETKDVRGQLPPTGPEGASSMGRCLLTMVRQGNVLNINRPVVPFKGNHGSVV